MLEVGKKKVAGVRSGKKKPAKALEVYAVWYNWR